HMMVKFQPARATLEHVLRIGCTGRMQEQGLALSLCASEERHVAARIKKTLEHPLEWSELPRPRSGSRPAQAPMVTLLVLGGKKAKVRPGGLLGALTGDGGLTRAQRG